MDEHPPLESLNHEPDFSTLVRRCAEKAYNFAYRLAGNEHDARDLVQEAFTRAFKHKHRYDPNQPFEAWLIRILRNIYLDGVRRYERGHTVSLDAPAPIEETTWEDMLRGSDREPLQDLLRKETQDMVQNALNSLPLQYRTAVTLCDVEELSYERIAEIMSCPIGTVRSRIHQGRVLMRRAFYDLQRESVR